MLEITQLSLICKSRLWYACCSGLHERQFEKFVGALLDQLAATLAASQAATVAATVHVARALH